MSTKSQTGINICKNYIGDLPGGTVVKKPPASAGDTALSPGPGRFHMPQRD